MVVVKIETSPFCVWLTAKKSLDGGISPTKLEPTHSDVNVALERLSLCHTTASSQFVIAPSYEPRGPSLRLLSMMQPALDDLFGKERCPERWEDASSGTYYAMAAIDDDGKWVAGVIPAPA